MQQVDESTVPESNVDPQLENLRNSLEDSNLAEAASPAAVFELDPDLILSETPLLNESAENLFDVATAPNSKTYEQQVDFLNQLKVPGSKQNKILRQRERSFAVHLDAFRNPEENSEKHPFIDAFEVMKAMGPTPDRTSKQWIVAEVVYKANITSFARWLVTSKRTSDAWEDMQRLDRSFPSPFMLSASQHGPKDGMLAVGNSSLEEETFQFALELRTQYAILALMAHKSDNSVNLSEMLAHIFYSKAKAPGELQLRAWNVKWLANKGDDSGRRAKQISTRAKDIGAFVSKDNNVKFDALFEEFGWQEFVIDGLTWAASRNDEISDCIEARGGISALQGMDESSGVQTPESIAIEPKSAQGTPKSASKRSSANSKRFVAVELPQNHTDQIAECLRWRLRWPS